MALVRPGKDTPNNGKRTILISGSLIVLVLILFFLIRGCGGKTTEEKLEDARAQLMGLKKELLKKDRNLEAVDNDLLQLDVFLGELSDYLEKHKDGSMSEEDILDWLTIIEKQRDSIGHRHDIPVITDPGSGSDEADSELVAALRKEIEQLKKKNVALEAENKTLKETIKKLEGKIRDKDNKLAELKEKLQNPPPNTDIADLKVQIQNLEKDTADYRKIIRDHETTIASQDIELKNADENANDLQNKLNNALNNGLSYDDLVKDLKQKENVQLYANDQKGRTTYFYDRQGGSQKSKATFGGLGDFTLHVTCLEKNKKEKELPITITIKNKRGKEKTLDSALKKQSDYPLFDDTVTIPKVIFMNLGKRGAYSITVKNKATEEILANGKFEI